MQNKDNEGNCSDMAESPCQRTHEWSQGQAWPSTQRVADLHFMSTHVSHTTHGLSVVHTASGILCTAACVLTHVSGVYAWTHTCTNAVPMSVSKCVPVLVANSSAPSNPTSLPTCTSPALRKHSIFYNSVIKRQTTQLKTGKGSEWTVLQRRNKNGH